MPFDRPLLQLALDETRIERAQELAGLTAPCVDIFEVGTLLLAAEGVRAVKRLRAEHPDHIIVADLRIIRAGKALAQLCFDAGANWITVMAEAPDETVAAAVAVARDHGGEVQIELGDSWTDDDLARWGDLGVTQLIMHRSHEADSVVDQWTDADLDLLQAAASTGLVVSVTGGVTLAEVGRFQQSPVGVFIAGRAIRGAEDPKAAAAEFQAEIGRVFP